MTRNRLQSLLMGAALASLPAAAAAQTDHDVTLHVNPRWRECAIQLDASLTQEAWRQFVGEAGLLTYFRPLVDAQPMGRGNWEVSVLRWQTGIDDTDPAWNDTFVHPDATHWLYEGDGLAFPGLTARVGVSNRVDLGAYFTTNPRSNYRVAGVQAQYAILRPTSPWGLAARLSLGTLFGPEDLNFATAGWDVLASRRFDVSRWVSVSPYVGVSSYVAAARETTDAVQLDAEVVPGSQAMVGAVLRVAMVRLAVEYNSSGVDTRSIKLGAAF